MARQRISFQIRAIVLIKFDEKAPPKRGFFMTIKPKLSKKGRRFLY